MSVDFIEDMARETGVGAKGRQEYERLLDNVAANEGSYILWNRLYLFSAALFFWFMMFACIIFLLGLEYDLALPLGLGLFVTVVMVICFGLFMVTMALRIKHQRALSLAEARAIAFLESR